MNEVNEIVLKASEKLGNKVEEVKKELDYVQRFGESKIEKKVQGL